MISGIANFNVFDGAIQDLARTGIIVSVDYLDVGKFQVNLSPTIPSGEVYHVSPTSEPGISIGVISQGSALFVIGVKNAQGDWSNEKGLSVALLRVSD